MIQTEQIEELAECRRDPVYFLDHYCQIYDANRRAWLPFHLWPAQKQTVRVFQDHHLVVVLKARQLGVTRLALGFALWLMIFRPQAAVLIFSLRDEEAKYLLGDKMLRGMFDRLPAFLRHGLLTTASSAHEWALSNGSSCKAFPTTGGRSYTATLAIVDEADHTEDLDALLNAVKPTVDAGGWLILVSTADKSAPESAFKRIYRGALAGANDWTPVFLPWQARPERDAAWYAEQERDVLARTGAKDDLFQEYPASDFEALAPRSLDKRFPAAWLQAADGTRRAIDMADGPAILGLTVFVLPVRGRQYVIGADPAEGNPQSDESAASVVDVCTGEQVAVLGGRFDPAVFAGHIAQMSTYFAGAPALVERNNHGHAVLLWLREFSDVRCLTGLDGKPGWSTTGASKPLAFDHAADMLRAGATMIYDRATLAQLAGIEGSSLAAPAGQHDDRAIAHVLALAALRWGSFGDGESVLILPRDVLADEAGQEW
jgi:hypothetical protein